MPSGDLKVYLEGALNIKDTAFIGKCSSYCILTMGAQSFVSDVAQDGGSKPYWNQTFYYKIDRSTNDLKIQIKAKNALWADDLLGEAKLDFVEVFRKGFIAANTSYPVIRAGRRHGDIRLGLAFFANKPETKMLECGENKEDNGAVPFKSGDRRLNILVLGDSKLVKAVCGHICGAARPPTPVEDHVYLTESRNAWPPMCLYGDTMEIYKHDFSYIKTFVKGRNERWHQSKVKTLWLDEVRHREERPALSAVSIKSRLHMLWFVCKKISDLPDGFKWSEITKKLYDLPVQILVTGMQRSHDLDSHYIKILEDGSRFFRNAQNVEELIVKVALPDGEVKENLWRKCWAAKTRAEIGNASKIIRVIREKLGSSGISVNIGVGGGRIFKEGSLSQSADFVLHFLCTYWDVPQDKMHDVLKRVTTFEQARGNTYKIKPCEFVKFCLIVAAIILYSARGDARDPRHVQDVTSDSSVGQLLQTGAQVCYNSYFASSTTLSFYDRMRFIEIRKFLEDIIFERKGWAPRLVASVGRSDLISSVTKELIGDYAFMHFLSDGSSDSFSSVTREPFRDYDYMPLVSVGSSDSFSSVTRELIRDYDFMPSNRLYSSLKDERDHVLLKVENRESLQDINNDIPNGATRSDHEFICALKKRLETITSIQIIDFEVFSRNYDHNQNTIVLGCFDVNNDTLEFYFESGDRMAKLIGVGLNYAKVIVKRGIICEIQEIEKFQWEKVWLEDIKEHSARVFKIMKVRLPITRGFVGSGQFEAGSHIATSSTSTNQVFQDHTFISIDKTFQIPFLWELSKKFIMESIIDTFHAKCNGSTWSESFEINSVKDCPKDGNETTMTWFQTLKVLFSKGTLGPDDNERRETTGSSGGGSSNGSGDGNGGGDDFPGDNSNVDLLEDKAYFTEVNVILLSGGDFFEKNMESFEPLSNRLPLSIERLSNVEITPKLTFAFCKTGKSKKIQITTSVIFALDRDCDSIDSCGHFGWFHDKIHASIGPLDRNIQRTVYLEHDFKEGESVFGKTTNTASLSKDTIKGKGKAYQVGVAIGSAQIARLELVSKVNQERSYLDHQSHEQSLESQCNQTHGGFKIQARPLMHEALLEYKYLAPYFEIVADQISDRKYRYDLSNHPLCSFQKTEFLGTWVPIGHNEEVEYIFKADRELYEIRTEKKTSISSSSGFMTLFAGRVRKYLEVHVRSSLERPITQAYEKQLYVNHAMTHLVDGQTYTLIESDNPQYPYHDLDAPLVTFPVLVDYQ